MLSIKIRLAGESVALLYRAAYFSLHNHSVARYIFFYRVHSRAVQLILNSIQILLLLAAGLTASTQTQSANVGSSAQSSAAAPTIVIGFVGGFVKRNDLVHSGVQLAARLRKDYPSGVHTEVFENRWREEAHGKIISLLDINHRATLSPENKKQARIIIYGTSWGASETVTLARELEKEGIPVLLTVQVDSISKVGQNDEVIPANVSEAANFYQTNGLLHGRPKIRAADEARTRILGNFRFDYNGKSIRCDKYPWFDRFFVKSHTEIECDPIVWKQIEALIRSKLPPVNANSALVAPSS